MAHKTHNLVPRRIGPVVRRVRDSSAAINTATIPIDTNDTNSLPNTPRSRASVSHVLHGSSFHSLHLRGPLNMDDGHRRDGNSHLHHDGDTHVQGCSGRLRRLPSVDDCASDGSGGDDTPPRPAQGMTGTDNISPTHTSGNESRELFELYPMQN